MKMYIEINFNLILESQYTRNSVRIRNISVDEMYERFSQETFNIVFFCVTSARYVNACFSFSRSQS